MIAAGGTAGHVVPALAIADALRAEGAEVVFAGGERAEAQLVPAAGYELEPLRVEGISRSNPLKAARAVVRAAGAVGAARRILARHGADAVLGGGGYVAGPVGLAALHAADPGRAHRGRLAPRPDQPPARAARPPRLPRLPDRGPRGRALPRHRPPGAADRRRPRRRARGVRHPAGRDLRARLRRLAGRAVDQPRGRRGVRRRALPRAARARRARLRRPARARPALPPARVRRPVRRARWSPPTSPSRAPAARCSSSPSTACRRC